MARTRQRPTSTGYQVRPFAADDRAAFLSLYETVWGCEKGRAWFEWRFGGNPYRDDVSMIVAESEGELVGAEPLLPFRLRVGDRVLEAFQPVDWIVHPDHRRRGLFTRMTESVLEQFADDADILFNFPNQQLLPGLRKFDWQTVGPVATSYRVQDARAVVDDQSSTTAPAAAARLGAPLVRGGLEVLDRVGSPPEAVSVERSADVPVETIHDLYAAEQPERVHVARDRPFLRWRFANPRWETTTYVARRDGEPVASAVAATERSDERTITQLLDVQPSSESVDRSRAFEAILHAVVSDADGAGLLKAPAQCYPDVLRRYGFCRDDRFPVSSLSTTTTHVVRPLGPDPVGRHDGGAASDDGADEERGAWIVDGRDLTDPDDWLLSLADRDTA